jgi:hypothetical protein
MDSFQQKEIGALGEALDLAWYYLRSAELFDADDAYAREVVARKIFVTAQGAGVSSVPQLANEAIRYARQFAAMANRNRSRNEIQGH